MNITKDEFKVLINELINILNDLENDNGIYYKLFYSFTDTLDYESIKAADCGCCYIYNNENIDIDDLYKDIIDKMKGIANGHDERRI